MNCLEKIAESPINKMFVSLQYQRYKNRHFKFKKRPKYRYIGICQGFRIQSINNKNYAELSLFA
jgi:hypothetical protein